MPVVAGEKSTKTQILVYSVALAIIAVLPTAVGMASMVYGSFAALLSAIFIKYAYDLNRADAVTRDAKAIGLFKYSILYLFLIFLALGADGAVAKLMAG